MGIKYFVSDFHFGIKNQEKTDFIMLVNFENFCKKNLISGDELYILGDFFDFWIEYKNLVQAKFTRIYTILMNIQKRGVKIFIIRGNHDFFRGNFWESLNISIFDNEIKFNQNGKNVLCIHGDGITKDLGYSAMKFVLRNTFFQFLYKLFPPDFAIWLAETLSGLSRKKKKKSDSNELLKEKYRKFAFDFINKKNCDILIMGHSHIPELTISDNKIYANSGIWFEKPTYIILETPKISLKEFNNTDETDIVLQEILLN